MLIGSEVFVCNNLFMLLIVYCLFFWRLMDVFLGYDFNYGEVI